MKNELKDGDVVRHSNKEIVESPEMEELAQQVIEKEGIDIGPASIGFLLMYPNIYKYTVGRARKTSKEEKHYSGNDYIIEISGETWDMLDPETKEKMLYYYLLHVDPVYKADKQEWNLKVRKPDFTDFYEVNEKYGTEWHKSVQSVVSSLYDLSPKKEYKVSI